MSLTDFFEGPWAIMLLIGLGFLALLVAWTDHQNRKTERDNFDQIATTLRVGYPDFKTAASLDLLLPIVDLVKEARAGRTNKHDQFALYRLVRLDLDSRRLAFYRNGDWIVRPFSDIIGAEIFSEGRTVTQTTGGRSIAGAAVGGALLGPAGMIVGGLGAPTKSTSVQSVNDVRLHINVADPGDPVIEAPLDSAKRTMAREPMDVAREWAARVNAIVHENARLSEGA